MASIRKRGSNSYLIVVSRGYDYEGNRLKSVQKTVKPPKEYTPKQAEKWAKEYCESSVFCPRFFAFGNLKT